MKAFIKSHLLKEMKNLEGLVKEVKIGWSLKHEFLADLIEISETEASVYLVYELLDGGHIGSRRTEGLESMKKIKQIVFSLIRGVCFISENNIVHRDLKPLNVLFKDNQSHVPKIIDFGFACDTNCGESTRCGTAGFIAPEMFTTPNEELGAIMNDKLDVFSIGVIFYNLIFGEFPFDGATEEEVINNNKLGNLNIKTVWEQRVDHVSIDAQELIEKMLEVDPSERLSIKDCLSHQFFAELNPARGEYDGKLDSFGEVITPDLDKRRVRGKKNMKKAFEQLFG